MKLKFLGNVFKLPTIPKAAEMPTAQCTQCGAVTSFVESNLGVSISPHHTCIICQRKWNRVSDKLVQRARTVSSSRELRASVLPFFRDYWKEELSVLISLVQLQCALSSQCVEITMWLFDAAYPVSVLPEKKRKLVISRLNRAVMNCAKRRGQQAKKIK